jgi:hypothetical protein
MPPVRAEIAAAPTKYRTAKAEITPQRADSWVHLSRSHQVRGGPIRVDRAASEIHHGMAAARAKPQVTGPDEFSAPTGSPTRSPRRWRIMRTRSACISCTTTSAARTRPSPKPPASARRLRWPPGSPATRGRSPSSRNCWSSTLSGDSFEGLGVPVGHLISGQRALTTACPKTPTGGYGPGCC